VKDLAEIDASFSGLIKGELVYEQCCAEVRWKAGKLQQRYLVHYRGKRDLSRTEEEWRDVPSVEEK
jgi:hypothetical protein